MVIALIALIGTMTAVAMNGGLQGMRLRSAAKEIATQLRFTRAQAIASGQPGASTAYRAAQLTNASVFSGSGGSPSRSSTGLSGLLPPTPSRTRYTTPRTTRGPSGTATWSPTLKPMPSGSA